jgi:hypothetical protein
MIRHVAGKAALAVLAALAWVSTLLAGPALAAVPSSGTTYTPHIAGPWTTLFSPTQPAPAGYMNDHTVVKGGDGEWHIIGISGGGGGAENSFASASTSSLTSGTWTEGPVLSAYYDANGNPIQAWAPYAMNYGGTEYMFYRSNRNGVDNLEVETTTDPSLQVWTRRTDVTVDGGGPGNVVHNFRDPMVFPYNGSFLMYAPGTEGSGNTNFLEEYQSTNLINWTHVGHALSLSGSATTAPWGSTESPFVFKYGDYYYLSTTITDSGSSTYHSTYIFRSTSPTDFGDFNGVSASGAGTLVTELAVHAPEYVADTNGQWYVTTAGWQNTSLYPEAKHGVAIAALAFANDTHRIPISGRQLDYSFDDQSSAVDSSGNGRNSSLQGDAAFSVSGKHNGSLSLDGTSFGFVPSPALTYSGDFTVAAWIKTTATPTNSNGLVSGSNQDINLYGAMARLYAAGDRVVSTVSTPANAWTHIAVTRTVSSLTMYVNGAVAGMGSWSGTWAPQRIGSALGGASAESLDDFVLYHRALSTAEIGQLSAPTPTIPGQGLDLWYTFDRPGAPTSVADTSGQGHTGIPSGSYAWGRDGQYGGCFTANAAGSGGISVSGISLSGDFSVAAWVRPTGIVTNTSGIFKGSGQDINFYQGHARLYAGTDVVISSQTVPSGAWTHVTITRQSGTVSIYIDGILGGQGTWTGTLTPAVVGEALAGNNTIGLDDLLVYNRALSASEVAGLS